MSSSCSDVSGGVSVPPPLRLSLRGCSAAHVSFFVVSVVVSVPLLLSVAGVRIDSPSLLHPSFRNFPFDRVWSMVGMFMFLRLASLFSM